jgi:beta-lactamase class A
MRFLRASLGAAALLFGSCASAGAPADLGLRVEAVAREAETGGGRRIAVAYCDLGSGTIVLRDARRSVHAASMMKVPVLLAVEAAVAAGALRLDQAIPVRNQFSSIVDRSRFELDPKEDGDPDLYTAVGGSRSLAELARRMIVRSSNLATNLLIELIGPDRVNAVDRALGARDIRVLRGVEDGKAYERGLNNTVTAYDLMVLLRAIAERKAVSPAASARMVDILSAQEFNEKIPAGLPPGTPVAHKTGDITGIHHDAAIVYPPGKDPYVLVVLTEGFAEDKEADRAIAAVSRLVWERRGAFGSHAASSQTPPQRVETKPPGRS